METIDRTSRKPLYKQVETYIRTGISNGRFGQGEKLPSIRELSKNLGLNHLTVRQAVNNLVTRGLLTSNRGRGTFVRMMDNRVRRVALVVPDLEVPLSASIARGVGTVARENNMELTIIGSHSDAEIESENLRRLANEKEHGFILFSMMGVKPAAEVLQMIMRGQPVVLIDRFFEDIPWWQVISDNRHGGYMLTRHLLDKGSRRIVFASHVQVTASRHRYEGYATAMREQKLEPRFIELDYYEDSGTGFCRATRELIENDRPDAIFYINDRRAIYGTREIKAAGLKVPDDIAVAGFDDTPMAALTDPPLTTVRQDAETIGRSAAELLLQQLTLSPEKRQAEPKNKVVPVELILREST
jgi:LacI family transcriptional regulator